MPLDELSPTQVEFIRKHFNTSVFRSKSKDELRNEAYERAATAMFREINRIGSLIDSVERAYEHAPVSMYRSELESSDLAARETIKGAKKDIKKGRAPDFTAVYARLTELEKRINLRIDQMRTGKGVDADAGLKQNFGIETIDALKTDMSDAEILFARVMREMPPSEQEAYTKRGIAIQAYRKLYAASLDSIGKKATELTEDRSVTLDACKFALNGMLAGFRVAAKQHTDVLDALLNAPPLNYDAERQKLKTDDKYTKQDVVSRAQQRGDAAAAEVTKLDDAIKKQLLKLDQLKKEFAEARNEDRSKAKTAFTNAKNQLAALQTRQQQLSAFVADGEKRDRTLIEATTRTDNLLGLTLELNEALKDDHASGVDELNEMVAALKERPMGFVEPTVPQDVTDEIDALRLEIAAAAKREVVIPKLDPKEAKLFELAANEAAALNGLLDVAVKCVADGKLDMAAALIEKVVTDKRAFLTARQALMLPAPLPPVPGDAKAFDLRAAGFQSRLRDLVAVKAVSRVQGGKDAATLLAEVTKLASDTRAEVKRGDDVDFVAKNGMLDALRPDIDKLAAPPATQALTDAKSKAVSTGKDVEQLLGKLMKTRKITKDDIIEVPNRAYTKEEREKLVRLDEIIEVMVDGKLEQHTIIQRRKGKGGQDLSVRKDKDQRFLGTKLHIEDKTIPLEATDALRRKAITLSMMSEVDSPESAEAMEAYRLEVEALAKDIEDNGETNYPKVEKIIEECAEKFKKGDLTEYIPADFAVVKAGFEKFVADWKKKSPTEALAGAEKHQTAILELEKAAVQVKADYEKFKEICKGILADLQGKKNKSETSDPLGKLMKATLKKTPDELFAGLDLPVDDPLIPQIAAARKEFEKVKNYYAVNTHHASDTMSGAWKTKAETAMSKLKTKEAGNIDEAIKDISDIKDGMHKFSTSMDTLDTAKGEDLAKLLLELVAKMKASADQEHKDNKDNVAYFALKKTLKEKISSTISLAKSKAKNPVAKLLLDQAKGIDKTRKVTTAETEADATWRVGLGSLERIERDIDDIAAKLGNTGKEKGEKIKNMRIGAKPDVLIKTIADLKTSAKDLVAKLVRPMIPTGDPDGLTANIDTLEKNLTAIDLPDVGALKKIAADIDKANDLAEKDGKTKDERIALREKALAEIRKIRNALENHPAIKLYRTNPFDGGTAVRLVQTVLHQVEIAVLACVSPHEKA